MPDRRLAAVLARLDEADALALVAEAESLPAAVLAVILGLSIGEHVEPRPVEAFVRFCAKYHANLNVRVGVDGESVAGILLTDVWVQTISDISVVVVTAVFSEYLARVTVCSVFEATVEVSCTYEVQIGRSNTLTDLIDVRPAVGSVDVVSARRNSINLCGCNAHKSQQHDYSC